MRATTRCSTAPLKSIFTAGRRVSISIEGAELAPLASETFATSVLIYRVVDDHAPDAVIIAVDHRLHSVPRWAAELHGGHALDSFDVSIELLTPGMVGCESRGGL